MNHRIVFLSAALLALPIAAKHSPIRAADGNPYKTAYPRAVIEYAVHMEQGHGGHSDERVIGEQIMYLDGGRLAKQTKLRTGDAEHRSHVREIHTPDHIYVIDMRSNEGFRYDNPKRQVRLAYEELSEREKRAFHERMEERGIVSFDLPYLGQPSGTDTVSGHECVLYSYGPEADALQSDSGQASKLVERGANRRMETCLWKDSIPLRVVTHGVGWKHSLEASSVRLNAQIDERVFTVPEDVEINYDGWRSEAERRHAKARFESYRNGTPMVVRIPMDRTGEGKESRPEND